MQLLTIALLSLLPFKNSYVGFRVTSFSHLPTSFVMEYRIGHGNRIGLDMSFGYVKESDSLETVVDTAIQGMEEDVERFTAGVGVSFIKSFMKRELGKGTVCGLFEVNPFFQYSKDHTKSKGEDGSENASSKVTETEFGARIKVGAEYGFQLFGLDAALRLVANTFTVEYNHVQTKSNDAHSSSFSERNVLNTNVFSFSSGSFGVWLLFKL